ncbi:hypothetical protein ACFPM7_28690 [Actinokineospora guangxiensis]|uniref:Uncharacterized protein n=1 Tax=Actinokineospora guangxiensis TaxID=1490288 RepID=A0ABW0EXY7_9PSEU
MDTHEYEAPADIPADEVYQHAADPANLPTAITGGEVGWCDADPSARTVSWGAEGETEARGQLTVHEESIDRCRIVVRSRHADGNVAEGVAELAHAASARTDSRRADQQQGWTG